MVEINKKNSSSVLKKPGMSQAGIFGAGAATGAVAGAALSSPSPRRNNSSSEKATSNPNLWEILVGLFLIIVQFILNKGFIGTGYSKYYFDLVFLGFLFLIAVNCRKDFFKVALVLGSSIFISFTILNHFNVISFLGTKLPIIGGADASVVIYYCIIIFLSAALAKAAVKDDDVDVMGYAFLAVLSIVIPFLLIKINPYSSYLISDAGGSSLIQLFFSIPILWQPFWISGIFKAKNNGSTGAKIFAFVWLLLLLGIVSIVSYFSVPIDARQNIQTTGSNTVTATFDQLQNAFNTTKKYVDQNILGIKDPEPVETQVDSEQKVKDKGFDITNLVVSETIVDFNLSRAMGTFDVNALAKSKGISDDSLSFGKTSCYARIQGYKGIFNDSDLAEVIIPGKINGKDDTGSINLERFSSGETMICSFDKKDIINKFQAKDAKELKSNILSSVQSVYFKSNYSFVTTAYLTRYFVDANLYRALKKEKPNYDDFQLLSELGLQGSEKYIKSRYSGGPLSIGIKLGDNNVIVPVDSSDNLQTRLVLEFSISDSNSDIKINEEPLVIISLPNSMKLDEKACSPIPLSAGDLSRLDEEERTALTDLLGVSDDMNLYGIESGAEFRKFFILSYDDNARRISCPISISGTSKITKGSIGVFTLYNVNYEKKKSYEIKA